MDDVDGGANSRRCILYGGDRGRQRRDVRRQHHKRISDDFDGGANRRRYFLDGGDGGR